MFLVGVLERFSGFCEARAVVVFCCIGIVTGVEL